MSCGYEATSRQFITSAATAAGQETADVGPVRHPTLTREQKGTTLSRKR